jgi:hypothetical protein
MSDKEKSDNPHLDSSRPGGLLRKQFDERPEPDKDKPDNPKLTDEQRARLVLAPFADSEIMVAVPEYLLRMPFRIFHSATPPLDLLEAEFGVTVPESMTGRICSPLGFLHWYRAHGHYPTSVDKSALSRSCHIGDVLRDPTTGNRYTVYTLLPVPKMISSDGRVIGVVTGMQHDRNRPQPEQPGPEKRKPQYGYPPQKPGP